MRYIALAFVLLVFSGCVMNRIDMKYESSVRPNYHFNINAPIIITHQMGDLLSASYVPFVIETLQRRGFTAVYKDDEISRITARNIVFISLKKITTTIPTSSFTYIPSKNLNQNACFDKDGISYCRKEDAPIITGYTLRMNLVSGYHFTMDWYDLPMQKRVLYINGIVPSSPCVYDGIYRDLIYQTIKRIDLSRSEFYRYSTPLFYYSAPCMISHTKNKLIFRDFDDESDGVVKNKRKKANILRSSSFN